MPWVNSNPANDDDIVYTEPLSVDTQFELTKGQMDEMVRRVLEIEGIEEDLRAMHDKMVLLLDDTYGSATNYPDGTRKYGVEEMLIVNQRSLIEITYDVADSLSGYQPLMFTTTKYLMGNDFKIPGEFYEQIYVPRY